ncbi:haloacid dehalogenase [Microbispora rosea subsp. aerata]|nr:HAD-IIA family hydrolase [Microbispora rosea]GGO00792.1 haloacid dehalogenase [Microbispora rosea subsp. aerata]GIH56470.1 haloacid dehalogenase [Microbispora rosea subsp. aerata]GLJ84363.1 haloacid dehalogenase [Microbispora rosea subsp. aerata]
MHPGDDGPLRGSDRPLVNRYGTGIFDLDGVVYRGVRPVPHAATALAEAARSGMRPLFLTNNSSRTPDEVAAVLAGMGIAADEKQVVTSAETAAGMAAERLPPGARVLVVGGPAVETALRRRGLTPVRSLDDEPVAVVQGFAPEVDWQQLAEAGFAVARGMPWIASDVDLRIARERGIAPGNGTLVDAIRMATGREPLVAGKPEPPIFAEAARRSSGGCLVIGDGLDTDVRGARRNGFDSALVLTGVTTVDALLEAPPEARPTYLLADLRGLLSSRPEVRRESGRFTCGRWTARWDAGEVSVLNGGGAPPAATGERPADVVDAVRVLCHAVWAARDTGRAAQVERGTRWLLEWPGAADEGSE